MIPAPCWRAFFISLYFREGLEQPLLRRVFVSARESRIGGGLESEVAAGLASDLLDLVREAPGLILVSQGPHRSPMFVPATVESLWKIF